jgi:uncharacterized protein (UPF0332 family)
MQPDRLARSQRELDSARLMLEHGYTEQACSHAYYAAFYAVQDAVAAAGKVAKTHSGTALQFRELLQQWDLPIEAGQLLSKLQEMREDTTYRFKPVSEAEVNEAIDDAEKVIEAAREVIARLAEE